MSALETERVQVHLQLPDGREVLAGTIDELIVRPRTRPVMAFRYSTEYLVDPQAYELSPDLPLDAELHVPAVHLSTFFAFRDVQPDRWGTRLPESAHGAGHPAPDRRRDASGHNEIHPGRVACGFSRRHRGSATSSLDCGGHRVGRDRFCVYSDPC